MTISERAEARKAFEEACNEGIVAIHDVAMQYFIDLCNDADALERHS